MDDAPAEATSADDGPVAVIAPRGDVVLDVDVDVDVGVGVGASTPGLKKKARTAAFRVESAVLKKHSRYFANLLGDTRFQEARAVEDALAALTLEGVHPGDAGVDRLPRVHIQLDDDGSRTADRVLVFAELLRILHWDGKLVEVTASSSSGEQGKQSKPPAKTAKAAAATRPGKTTRSEKTPPAWTSKTAAAKKTQPADATHSPPQAVLPGSRWSAKTPPTLLELATLAIQADRFACTEAVGAYVRTVRTRAPSPVLRAAHGQDSSSGHRGVILKKPAANTSSSTYGLPCLTNEDAIRQKVFVAWRLDQPLRFHTGTRELILHGSQQWAAALAGDVDNADDPGNPPPLPPWWELPDSIESELQFRRACIVNCIASVPRHFLRLYMSRNGRDGRRQQQCKMGYETSAACDSFQLGEMIKFLYHKDLVFLQDFSCSLLSSAHAHHAHHHRDGRRRRSIAPSDYAAVDVAHILATLKQCPAYQLDKHHVNCGLRTRLLPILEYIQAMLGATTLGLHRHEWAQPSHGTASWLAAAEAAGLFDDDYDDGSNDDNEYNDMSDDGSGGDDGGRVPLFGKPRAAPATDSNSKYAPKDFRFTRAVAGDPRLRMAGSMAASAMARDLFTARRWNWTPEG